MSNIISKILTGIKANLWGLSSNPLFYFGLVAAAIFGAMYVSCGSSANANLGEVVFENEFLNNGVNSINTNTLFSSKADAIALETPDLKTIENNTLCGVATPCVVSSKTLGDVFGGSNLNQKDVVNYIVQPGDSFQSIASSYQISLSTLLWANDMTKSSTIKVGQSLAILPTDGVLRVVKSGDTVPGIAQTYKAKPEDIISYNGLANQDDIYVGDVLIVPGGVMPKSGASINGQVPLPNDFFIFPVQGTITQGLHYYNAVDIANKCGTPIYAAAAGVVQRAVGNGGWNNGMGNHITILHSNGTVTYYGHLMTLLVKSGDQVYTGQNIAFMGGALEMAGAGDSTGCHVHFEVIGARNPLSGYPLGSKISYK